MSTFLQFAILGIASGGVYALLATGVVQIYRGSGIVNFAQGAMALVGAIGYFETYETIGKLPAVGVGVLAGAVFGVLIQVALMRPLRHAAPIVRVVATLGVLAVVEQAARLHYGQLVKFAPSWLPSKPFEVTPGVIVPVDRLWSLGISILITAGLWLVYTRARFGIATTAVAENDRVPASLGWSTNLIAVANWAVGGGLAGLSGCFLVPIVGLNPAAITLTVIPALAAALIGKFSSYQLTVLGAIGIGILQSLTTRYVSQPGWPTAVPFLVIVVILIMRGQALPLRGHINDRLPKLGSGKFPIIPGTVLLVAAALLALVAKDNWVIALTTTAIFAFLCLSLVVVTGYAGQLSLAQMALAGIGALVSARLADKASIPFILACLIGVTVTVVVGMLLALPAVRARGVNLAVATMGLATVITALILTNPYFTGGLLDPTVVPTPTIFGWDIGSTDHPRRYAVVCLVLLGVACLAVSNLRRGRGGRRLIAVRDNERAAASLGINVVAAKVYAFGLGAALAAIAGVLIAFRNPNVSFEGFDVLASINVVLLTIIGGVGYIGGTIVGGTSASSGLFQEFLSQWVEIGDQFMLIAAILLLLILLVQINGAAHALHEQADFVRAKLPRRSTSARRSEAQPAQAPAAREVRRVPPKRLELKGVTMRFGGVTALSGLDLIVEPGQIVGLIGPNGAGKTTAIDAASGYLRKYEGQVMLDGVSLNRKSAFRRARAGLTRSFQSLELFEDLSVSDNIACAVDTHDIGAYLLGLGRPANAPLPDAAMASIDEFGLRGFLDEQIEALPYAQRRLVAIARAVAMSGSVLMLDEPAAGLDSSSTRELAVLLRRLADDWGMGILLVEHDVPLVMSVCDRVSVLNFGELIAEGTPAEVRAHPAVITAYLGTSDVESESPAVVDGGPGPESTVADESGVQI